MVASGLDVKHVEETVDQIIADPLYWFPVRHHSPATALHLKAAIMERKPKIILIEGPSESNELIPILQDAQAKPPVAVYSCFEDVDNQFGLAGIKSASEDIAPRWACWYPFMEYSPELVAIRTAKKIGATVRFIDLPHYARIDKEWQPEVDPAATDEPADVQNENTVNTDKEEPSPRPDQERNYETEKFIVGSDFYQSLASAGGYKNWDEAWDALFEFRQFESTEEFRRELLEFCAASRLTSSPTEIDFNENLDRERFMMQSIRNELKQNKLSEKDAMVVCGGYHTSMDRNDVYSAAQNSRRKSLHHVSSLHLLSSFRFVRLWCGKPGTTFLSNALERAKRESQKPTSRIYRFGVASGSEDGRVAFGGGFDLDFPTHADAGSSSRTRRTGA